MAGIVRRVWQDADLLWWLLFAGAFACSAAGTCIVLGGLAAVTNYCLTSYSPTLGIGIGLKFEPPLSTYTMEVMRIQRALVTDGDGTFNCGRFFRLDWFLWSLQFVFLCIAGVMWWMRQIQRFLPGLAVVGAVVTAWHVEKINYVVSMEPWTKGDLHTDGMVIGFGLIACCIGNFLMLFFAGPYSEREDRRMHPVLSEATTAGTPKMSDGNGKNGNGSAPDMLDGQQV